MKKLLALLVAAMLLFSLCGCQKKGSDPALEAGINEISSDDDIIILFTNDVHCSIDENIGYAGLSAYKKDMEGKYKYVVLADCGDFSQGSYEGAVSKGECIVELMNAVGYDFAVIGNHEFDFGMEQLEKNIRNLDAQFLNCNVTYTGDGEDWLGENTKPYEIKTFGRTKVAFIGISTPWSVTTSTPTYFMEDGKYVYDFCGNAGADYFYANVQKNVDECREKGADFVVILSHLGVATDADSPFTSLELIENTTGIDAVLDAHTHVEASCWIQRNKDGEDVLLSSTGTKLANIGKLVLSQDGTASVGYVDSYAEKDDAVAEKIASVHSLFDEQMNAVVGHTDMVLSCSDGDGIRMVRSRELAIGDFVADAYRIIGGADIGMCNGGGIRADLPSGDITYRDIIAVNPYGNTLCVVKVTGAEIVDMLEFFCRNVQAEYEKDGKAFGEDGNFQQVSGLSFTVDTSIESSALADESGTFIGVGGERRVSDVKILRDGVYVPIELDAVYTLASHNYMIKNGGAGMLDFLADHELVIDESGTDYQMLIDYIALLDGDLSQYESVAGRITIN